MIDCKCDNCSKDCSSDYIYCQNCWSKLEDEISNLSETIEQLQAEIKQLQDHIDRLEN